MPPFRHYSPAISLKMKGYSMNVTLLWCVMEKRCVREFPRVIATASIFFVPAPVAEIGRYPSLKSVHCIG
jgi:hypothetical protein